MYVAEVVGLRSEDWRQRSSVCRDARARRSDLVPGLRQRRVCAARVAGWPGLSASLRRGAGVAGAAGILELASTLTPGTFFSQAQVFIRFDSCK